MDKIYSELWEQDRLAKESRAAKEEEARKARNALQKAELDRQLRALEERRQHEADLQAEAERLRVS